jgi:hypothetical protein
MIGPKKLRIIRQELHRAFAATGQDPIRWLDQRMAAGDQDRAVGSNENEVLQSLQRFLRNSGQRSKRVVAKAGGGSTR